MLSYSSSPSLVFYSLPGIGPDVHFFPSSAAQGITFPDLTGTSGISNESVTSISLSISITSLALENIMPRSDHQQDIISISSLSSAARKFPDLTLGIEQNE